MGWRHFWLEFQTVPDSAPAGLPTIEKKCASRPARSGPFIFPPILKYGSTYSTDEDIVALLSSHPLIEHLDDMRNAMAGYDFGWIQETDTKWAS